MLNEICAEIKNYFSDESERYVGDWTIEGGVLTPPLDFPSDYIRIVGSHKNDGVHQISKLSKNPLQDESFHGAIWIMCPPNDFLSLVAEIESWQEMYGGASSNNMGPFQSESFGGYSYSKGSGSSGNGGGSAVPTWASQYASRLNIYRRIRTL